MAQFTTVKEAVKALGEAKVVEFVNRWIHYTEQQNEYHRTRYHAQKAELKELRRLVKKS